MSERLKNINNVSNEEVIDDLTKNLEFTLRSGDEENLLSPDTHVEEIPSSSGDFKEPASTLFCL